MDRYRSTSCEESSSRSAEAVRARNTYACDTRFPSHCLGESMPQKLGQALGSREGGCLRSAPGFPDTLLTSIPQVCLLHRCVIQQHAGGIFPGGVHIGGSRPALHSRRDPALRWIVVPRLNYHDVFHLPWLTYILFEYKRRHWMKRRTRPIRGERGVFLCVRPVRVTPCVMRLSGGALSQVLEANQSLIR